MSAVRFFVLLTILKSSGLYVTCTLQTKIFGSGNTAVCVGDRVTFTCSASNNLTTQERWVGSNWGLGNQVVIAISDLSSVTQVRGSFNVSLVSTSPVLVTKVEVASATLTLNGTTITCQETTNGAAFVDVGNSSITFAAPPSDPVASPANCTLDSVTLQWNGSLFDGGSNLTNYTLTSSPPTPNCNGSCAVAPTSRQYTFSGLQPGVPYTLGVSGTNCGGTQQGAQNNISVTIPYPQPPFVCLVFDAATSKLIQLSSTWYPLRINNNSLLCGPVGGGYNITCAGSDQTDVYSIPAANCSSNCSHLLDVRTRNSSQYNVSVAGFGVLSTIQTIVSTNNILKVGVANWRQPVTINCTFLPGLVGTSGCVVSFGTSPDYLPYTNTSSQSGGSGQSVSVQLTINGAPLNLNTSYFYTASLQSANSTNPCVTIKGSLCAPRALGNSSVQECICSNGSLGLQIPNGCLCYTGITPGSQATVECSPRAHQVGSGVPICQPNGSWSSAPPTCSLIVATPIPIITTVSVGTIVGAVIGSIVGFVIVVALIVVLAVAVVLVVMHYRHKKEAPKPRGVHIIEESKSGVSSKDYPLVGVNGDPLPARSIYSSDKNDQEWAAIMTVVHNAGENVKSTP